MKLTFIFLLTCLLSSVLGYVHINCYYKSTKLNISPDSKKDIVQSDLWTNEQYSNEDLHKWWNNVDKSLISIGSNGVQPSHLNSMIELLKSHERVRVKLSSDKLNSVKIAKEFINNDILSSKVELLMCRVRGFMVGRTSSTEVIPRKPGYYRDPEWFNKKN
jgi:RNA-binding protein YhbY